MTKWHVYLMTNRKRAAFYCGCTDELDHEVRLHRSRRAGHLVGKRHLTHVIWTESFTYEDEAMARCLEIRSWSRTKKLAFIAEVNPQYTDVLAAARRAVGDVPKRFDWRKLAKTGHVGPGGPIELADEPRG